MSDWYSDLEAAVQSTIPEHKPLTAAEALCVTYTVLDTITAALPTNTAEQKLLKVRSEIMLHYLNDRRLEAIDDEKPAGHSSR